MSLKNRTLLFNLAHTEGVRVINTETENGHVFDTEVAKNEKTEFYSYDEEEEEGGEYLNL